MCGTTKISGLGQYLGPEKLTGRTQHRGALQIPQPRVRGYRLPAPPSTASARLAYSEILTDERKETALRFLAARQFSWSIEFGMSVRSVDNVGSRYRSHAFGKALGIRNPAGPDPIDPKPPAMWNGFTAPGP
jgi:hypothetical protein